MQTLDEVLHPDQLAALRSAYETPDGKTQMDELLRGYLPQIYAGSGAYVNAVADTYFDGLTPGVPEDYELNESDRERCIIALLAAQGGQYTLAVHIYVGLMVGITPQEIAHVLLLSGVYAGVNRFAEGMFVHLKTLQVLQDLKDDLMPKAANAALRAAFVPAQQPMKPTA